MSAKINCKECEKYILIFTENFQIYEYSESRYIHNIFAGVNRDSLAILKRRVEDTLERHLLTVKEFIMHYVIMHHNNN